MHEICPGCADFALAGSPTHTRVSGQCQYSGPEWNKYRAPELEDDSPPFTAPSDGGGDPPPKAPSSTTPTVLRCEACIDKLPRTRRQHNRVKGQCDFFRDVYPYMFFPNGSLHNKRFYLIKVIDKWLDPGTMRSTGMWLTLTS